MPNDRLQEAIDNVVDSRFQFGCTEEILRMRAERVAHEAQEALFNPEALAKAIWTVEQRRFAAPVSWENMDISYREERTGFAAQVLEILRGNNA